MNFLKIFVLVRSVPRLLVIATNTASQAGVHLAGDPLPAATKFRERSRWWCKWSSIKQLCEE